MPSTRRRWPTQPRCGCSPWNGAATGRAATAGPAAASTPAGKRAQGAAAELVTAITEESLADLTVLRSTEDADWFHIEVDGGAYCPLAYSLEQMPVD